VQPAFLRNEENIFREHLIHFSKGGKIMIRLTSLAITVTLILLGSAKAQAGSGAPSGSHYNLNIIGVPKNKTADMSTSMGHRIFVPLAGKTSIGLREGDFQVIDANGTDGKAGFQLPNPDPENDGITTYSVYARALGKPGGSSTMSTCATVVETGEYLCSTQTLVSVRSSGSSKFSNVSADLLYMYVDLDGDGTAERYNIFNEALEGFAWEYDNSGLKLLQLRFYPISTDVN
jgi:hypothetical protein